MYRPRNDENDRRVTGNESHLPGNLVFINRELAPATSCTSVRAQHNARNRFLLINWGGIREIMSSAAARGFGGGDVTRIVFGRKITFTFELGI